MKSDIAKKKNMENMSTLTYNMYSTLIIFQSVIVNATSMDEHVLKYILLSSSIISTTIN